MKSNMHNIFAFCKISENFEMFEISDFLRCLKCLKYLKWLKCLACLKYLKCWKFRCVPIVYLFWRANVDHRGACYHMCHGQGCRVFLGMGNLPPLMTGILVMGPYKPLQTLGLMSLSPFFCGNNGSWSTRSHIFYLCGSIDNHILGTMSGCFIGMLGLNTSQGTKQSWQNNFLEQAFFTCFGRQSLRSQKVFFGLPWSDKNASSSTRCIHIVRITRKSNVSSFIHLLLKVDTVSLRQIAHESDVTEESGKIGLKFWRSNHVEFEVVLLFQLAQHECVSINK